MWEIRTDRPDGDRLQRLTLQRDGSPACYGDVMDAWRSDERFRDVFIDLLAADPHAAYYWETRPVSTADLDRPFECVTIESTLLADVQADTAAFAEHFDSAAVRDDVVAFPNLGHDALLITPCPAGPAAAYPHLAAFARRAPRGQQHALWQRVGTELEVALAGGLPIWVSTAGQGVFWLHVRLDKRPKYYNYGPYRRAAGR